MNGKDEHHKSGLHYKVLIFSIHFGFWPIAAFTKIMVYNVDLSQQKTNYEESQPISSSLEGH